MEDERAKRRRERKELIEKTKRMHEEAERRRGEKKRLRSEAKAEVSKSASQRQNPKASASQQPRHPHVPLLGFPPPHVVKHVSS